jgi:hypothetical protein
MEMQHGHRNIAWTNWTRDMQHGHGDAALIMDMETQHGYGNAAWIMGMETQHGYGHVHAARHGHAAWT